MRLEHSMEQSFAGYPCRCFLGRQLYRQVERAPKKEGSQLAIRSITIIPPCFVLELLLPHYHRCHYFYFYLAL